MKKRIIITIVLAIAFSVLFSIYAFAGVKVKSIKNTYSGVKVSWKCSNKNVIYSVFRSENGSKYLYYGSQKKKSFIDKSVETGNEYRYIIRAYRIKNNRVKYVGKNQITKSIMALPKAPANLSVIKNDNTYSLKWDKVDDASKYYIYRSPKGSNEYILYDMVGYNQNTYVNEDLDPDLEYDYKVQTVQVIDGIQYFSLISDESYITGKYGIDVSYHNGLINWKKVKQSGISFAMIRLGYGTKKGGFTDVKLDYNYKQARKYGIKIGFYFYSYANSKKRALKEAKYTVKLLKKYPHIQYPVSYDFEEPSRCRKKYKKSNTAIIKTYCNYLEKRGYDTSVYSFLAFFKKAINYKKVSKYGIWLARWTKNPNYFSNGGIPNVEMWQYTSSGKKKGIKGRVDLNIIVK